MDFLLLAKNFSYLISVTSVFLGTYFFFRFKIKKEEKHKLKSIKKREINDAVETDSPIDDQEKQLKEEGIHGIENKFSVINKSFPLILAFLWFVVVSVPYLGKIPTTYISIVAAVVSVVAGVSLRPFLENLFSGVVISFFRSIKIGDTVIIDGHYGLIEEIGLAYSVLKRWDWNRIVIPNSALLQKEIQNLTMNDPYIWAHIEFFISPDSDLAKVEAISKMVTKDSKYFNNVEEASFWVMEMQKDTIKCWVAAWADSPSDAWELRNDMRTRLFKELQKENIHFHQINLSK